MPLIIRRKCGEELVLRHADTGDLVRLACKIARRGANSKPTLHIIIDGTPGVFNVIRPERQQHGET